MDTQNLDIESRRSSSFSRLSGTGSSRRYSLSISFSLPRQIDDSDESNAVSEAGDIGERALHSNRTSISGRSAHFSLENGAVVPLQEDNLFQPSSNTVGQSALDNVPLTVDATTQSEEKKNEEEDVPWLLEYTTCLLSLAVFGILGVLARYGLQKLFGPGVIGATSDHSFIYPDLFANMVGSFFMGWLGVVFKPDIIQISDQLAIGLTTGFLGSLTTFSGWNQKMLDLSVNGQWVFAFLGFFLGLFLVAYSIILGIESAKGLKWLHRRTNSRSFCGITTCNHACITNKYYCILTFMTMLLVMLVLLWGIFGSLARKDFESGSSEAQLFLACMVGPFGVWIRWYLARFNGPGLGKNGRFKWMPFGTLVANVLAVCVMAALAILKKAVDTRDCDTVASGIQLGLLGCLSTVSTFMAEFHAMRESKHPWRAYAYATVTFVISFCLGTLIYSVPIWVRGYD